jgi:glycosyltransferase involved in cell wall biosynthesis
MKISVVILCYKAGEACVPFVDRVKEVLNKLTPNWELVLVGNYLKDDHDVTPQVVREIAAQDIRIKAITLEKQGMMGWDARSGLNAATGAVIALIDGDNQMPADDIARVYEKLTAENLDIAMTYRRERLDSFLRFLYSRIYNVIFKALFPGLKIRDVNSKPKIMDRKFFNKLKLTADGWFLDAEIMIQARRLGAKVGEIPTIFYPARDRKSFVRFDSAVEFALNLVRARISEFFIK